MKRITVLALGLLALSACRHANVDQAPMPSTDDSSSSISISVGMRNTGDDTEIDPQYLRVGDKVGNLTVSAKSQTGFGSIEFKTEMIVRGAYVDNGAYEDGALSAFCVVQDPQFTEGIPVLDDDKIRIAKKGEEDVRICFDRKEAIGKGFPKGTRGTATVVLSDYRIDLAHGENANEVGKIAKMIVVKEEGTINGQN